MCFFLLFTVYAGRWCCKKWILRKKVFSFLINFIVVIFILSSIGAKGASIVFSHNRIPFWDFFSPSVPLVILFSFLGVLITYTRSSLLKQMNEARIVQEQKQSELDLLLSQLSPHFLFNILNNLYGLSLTQHEKIPNLLLKLSDLLRYSVYDTNKAFVPLSDELAYILNYIELEKIHLGDRLLLFSNIDPAKYQSIKIAPMLLIVFIENAFKHSKNTADQKISIRINFEVEKNILNFTVNNSCRDKKQIPTAIREHSGVGLANTIKRLELLYPGEYTLNQQIVNNKYFVTLQLPVK